MKLKKALATLLTIIYVSYSCPVVLYASTISGVTPEGNTYNITAEKVSGTTGFREYDTFDLTQGDIANLVYTDSYDKFLNMSDSQISLNGIVNTVKNNAFYADGRAIFVSSSGVVVGASGVLNVGSLDLLSTSAYSDLKSAYADSNLSSYEYGAKDYNNLITNASGDVVINGIVLSRDQVNANGTNITVGGTAGENGIVAGWTDSSTIFTDRNTALKVFQSLVSGDVTNADTFYTDDRGNISLKATTTQKGDSGTPAPDNGITSSISLENTSIAGSKIDIVADSQLGSATLPMVGFGEGIYSDYSKAKITIKGSSIAASDDLNIESKSDTTCLVNALELPDVILAWLLEVFEDPVELGEEIETLFSSDTFDDFTGARSYSYVDIDSSKITSDNNLNITTDSNASYTVTTSGGSEESIPFQSLIHALGTETESIINVTNQSELDAFGTADIKALSDNQFSMQAANDNAMFKMSETDAFSIQFFHLSTSVDTEVNISDSSVTAGEVSVRTLSNVDDYLLRENSATVLKNDFASPTEGGSGAALIGVVNNSKTKNEVNITNSELEAIGADKSLLVEAVSVQNIDITGRTRTDAQGAKEKDKIAKEDGFFNNLKGRFDNFVKVGKNAYSKYKSYTYGSWYKLFKMLYSKLSGTAEEGAQQAVGEAQELSPALFQASGSFLFSNNTNSTAVNISGSRLKSAQDIDINSHLLDKYHNQALAHAKEPSGTEQTAIVGAGIALVINNRDNSNNIVIDNSRLESVKDTNINAVTELPGNGGSIGLDSKYLVLDLGFGTDAEDDWDFTFNRGIGIDDQDRQSLSPWVGLTGFFNNAAAAGTTGDSLAVAASVVYNNTKNNTVVDIRNGSEIIALNTRADAVNSVATRSDAGFLGSTSIVNIKEEFNVWNSDGTGASVLVQNIENNAKVNMEGSKISATEDVNLFAASEQSYVNLLKMFTDAPTIAAGGAVSVQDYTGTTAVNIAGSSSIAARDVKVNAGQARVSLGKLDLTSGDLKGLPVIENNRLVLEARRDALDHVTAFDVVGEISKQESGKEKEVTAAVGAAVNVQTIDRTVNAVVDNSTIKATRDFKFNSVSFTRNVELSLAGSLSGGASADTQNVASWQKKADKSDKSDKFFEDMLAKIDDAFPKEEVDEIEQGVEAAKDSAQKVGGSKYSFSIAGSVNVLNNDVKVNTSVRNGAKITADREVDIASGFRNTDIILSGGFAKSGTVGTGAAVNLFSRGGSVSSIVGGTIVSGTKTTVDATEDNEIFNFAVGVGYTGDSSKPTEFDGAIGGSFAYNAVESDTVATVDNATISGKNEGGTDVSVHAEQKVSTFNIAGALTVESGSKFSAGAALAGSADYVNSNVGATVDNSELTANVNNLTVLAEENTDLLSIGVALDAVGNYAKYGTPFDGSLGVVYLDNNIYANLENSKVEINKDLVVKADNQVSAISAQGNGAYSGATSGISFGGGWVFDIQNNKVSANLNPGAGDDYKLSAGSVEVNANSFEKLNAIPVTVGIARSSSVLASTVVVNLVLNEVSTSASGNITTKENADFLATDESYLLTRGGTLAVAGSQATTVIGASVNLDKLSKTVSTTLDGADVTATGNVNVHAQSIDANGGTRKDDGSYDRDRISDPDYQEKLLVYDKDKNEYTDINRDDVDNSFANWNMFYNLGFGAKSTITGAVVVKYTENSVNAVLKNGSTVFANALDVNAKERIVKNIVAGSLSATENLGVGVQVVYTKDAPEVTALITDNSSVGTADTVSVKAQDVKDNNTVVVAGTVAMGEGGAIDMNVVLNDFEDKLNASIGSSSSVDAGKLDLEANEDVNSTRVLVQVSAAKNAAMNVQPLENDYKENLSASVDGSTVGTQGNSSTEALVVASADHKTRDIVVGVAAAAQGVSLTGIEINNEYNNTVNSSVTSSTANISKLDVNAKNHIYADNWAILLEGTGQGVSIGANVIVNDIKSTNTSLIKDSTITASGDVSLSAYAGRDDNYDGHFIRNTTGSLGVTGQGAALEANLLLNTYSNKTAATVTGSTINAANLDIKASSKRSLNNTNITVVAAGEGAALGGSVTYNDVESDSEAVLETDDNDITLTGDAKVRAEDYSTLNNITGTGSAAAIGGAAMANVVILKNKGTSSAGIQGSGNGKLNTTGSVSVNARQSTELSDVSAGVSLGIGSLAGTVKLVTIGEKTDYTDLEKNAGLDSAVSGAYNRIKNLFGRNLSQDKASGAYADINGNVTGSGNIEVEAITSLGSSNDRISLNNTDVTVSGGSAGVGILSLNLNGNSAASISGGTVSAGGALEVNSVEADYADIKSTGLTIAGLSFSGGISSYNNNANSSATISDATVSGSNVYIQSKTSSDAKVEIDGISLGGLAVNVAGYETNVNYNSQALLTGKTNVSTDGNVLIASQTDVNTYSGSKFDAFTGGGAVTNMSNNVTVGGNSTALIKDAEGSIKADSLYMETEFSNISVEARNNVVSVSGISIAVVNGGVNLNPVFTSGIDNTGKNLKTDIGNKTVIKTGYKMGDDNMKATAGIYGTGVSLSGYAQSQAQATSNAVSKTVLKSDLFETPDLEVYANLDADVTASTSEDSISAMNNVNSIEVDATAKDTLIVEIDGTVNATLFNVSAKHTSNTSVSAESLAASLFESGTNLTLNSNNDSTTDVNVKGNVSSNDFSVSVETDRTGSLDASNRTGGAISDGSRKFTNIVKGQSNLTIDGLNAKGTESFTVGLASNNTHNDKSRSENGGFFAYEKSDYDYEFDTSSSLNLKNSAIEGFHHVDIGSTTANTIKDSSVTSQGGFIVITSSSAGHDSSSASAVSLADSTISGDYISISSKSSNGSDVDDQIVFKAESGGFYTEDDLKLDNTMNQTNDMSISNTSIIGSVNTTIALETGQNYKQKVDADSSGFIASPTVRSWLTSNNTNNLTIDEKSAVKADGALQFTFDVQGNLRTYSHVLVEDAGSDPETESHLKMNADNTMTLSGIAEGGSLNSVVFMGSSNNDLHQESYSEHFAVAPFTTEGGDLKRTINNTLTITGTGLALSGNAIDYQFNSGTGDIYASNHYHCIYYAAFGYETYGETSSNKTLTTNNTANVPGKMAAGLANNKILVVDVNGQVDRNSSYGVYESDYITYGDGEDLTPEQVKEKVVGNIQEKIDNLNSSLKQVNNSIVDAEHHHSELKTKKENIEDVFNAVEAKTQAGFVLGNDATVMEAITLDLAKETGWDTGKYEQLLDRYVRWTESPESKGVNKNIRNYVANVDTQLSSEEKLQFNEAADVVFGHMSTIPLGENGTDTVAGIIVYNNEKKGADSRKYLTASYGSGEDVKNVLLALEDSYEAIANEMSLYENRKKELQSSRNLLQTDIASLNADLAAANAKPASEYGQDEYDDAILLHNFKSTPGSITITGIDKGDIRVGGERIGDNLDLLSSHIVSTKNRLDITNKSDRIVVLKDADLSGDDSLRFTSNGEDLSKYITDIDLFVTTASDVIDMENLNVRNYGLIRNGSKTAEIINSSMEIHEGVLVQLYTAQTGAFDFRMDSSNLIVTTAPVIAASQGLVVKNYFGYHTAETFGFSLVVEPDLSSVTGIFRSTENVDEEEPVVTDMTIVAKI